MCVCVFCTFYLWYLTVVLIGMFLIAANTKNFPPPPPPEDTGSSYNFLFEVTIKPLTTLKNLGCLFTADVGAI